MSVDRRNRERRSSKGYRPPFSTRLLAPRFWGLWFGLGLLRLLSHLPSAPRRAVGAALGDLAYRRQGKRRAIVRTNLAWCFPEKDEAEREAIARDYFHILGQTMLDYGLLWWVRPGRLRRLIAIEGEQHLRDCLSGGRRVILFTGHSVALDFGAIAVSLRYPIVGPMKQVRNPLLDRLIARGRTRFQCRVFIREEGIRPVVQCVRRGEIMYYLPDEDLGATEQTVFAPFFGVPTATLTALGRLARVCDAKVLPCMTYFNPGSGRYTLRIGEPLTGFPTGDPQQDAVRMNQELEAMIRRAPEQYMWSQRIFQTRPDGAPPPYAMKGKPGSGHRSAP